MSVLEMVAPDQTASQRQEGFVHESGALVASSQALDAVQPRLHLLGHVTTDAQPAAMAFRRRAILGRMPRARSSSRNFWLS